MPKQIIQKITIQPYLPHIQDFAGIYCIDVSPCGNYIVCGLFEDIIIYDVKLLKQVGNTLIGHISQIFSVKYTPSGQLIVSSCKDRTIRFWNPNTQKEVNKNVRAYTLHLTPLSCSPNGNYLTFGSYRCFIQIWNCREQKQTMALKNHDERIQFIQYSQNCKYILTCTTERIYLWNLQTQIFKTLYGMLEQLVLVEQSKDSHLLFTVSRTQAMVWSLMKRKLVRKFPKYASKVNSASLSSDQQYIVTSSQDYFIHLWIMKNASQFIYQKSVVVDDVQTIKFSNDSKHIYCGSKLNVLTIIPTSFLLQNETQTL